MGAKILIAGLSLVASACATLPASSPSTPSGPMIPSGTLNLGGEWRQASVGAVLERFQREVSGRYAVGLQMAAVEGDLRGAAFNCSRPRNAGATSPTEICRKTETVGDCTHTWQVHLFNAPDTAMLARSRALYDRRCGSDGLLGGPN